MNSRLQCILNYLLVPCFRTGEARTRVLDTTEQNRYGDTISLRMLNLLLVEDKEKLRTALKAGLEALGSVRVVNDCASGEEALALCLAQPPQVILMDVQLAGAMNGVEAAVAIRREFPRMPVVFYSIQDDDHYYRDFRRSGILSHYAYVRKSNYLLPQMIAPLLHDAVAGRSFIDPEIESRVQEVR